jgi:hypothetical protein
MTTAAYSRIGGTNEYNLEYLEELLLQIYPGKAFSVFNSPDIPEDVAKIIGDNGFNVTVEDGDAYDKNQWLKVEDDFDLGQDDFDLSKHRQKYADALAMELLA